MTSIEERIVSLGFNNKSFEQHAAQSMSTLDKLDGMLNAFGGSKGVGLLTDTLEAVSSKFSIMGTIGDQVLRRIADGAMDAANKLIQVGKSMSIDQISAGWGKYQQKTASVQTIMNSTGDSIDKVNGYLSELMWYSDETSFGFTDMTSALGQMTSTGGKVENLIPLLMGVGNAVAYAGKGASEFSRVVYNLNQSYGAGALQLMDWKSLELAGVASKELKQAFIDVAIAQGKIKEGEVTVANFNQTLSKKWADTAVMEGAFGKFAEMTMEAKRLIDAGVYRNATEAYQALASKYGEVAVKAAQSAQEAKSFTEAIEATQDAVSSGWLTTFEHIFGNYEEAKVLWTNLTDVLWEMFAAGAEMRNEVLERWHNAKVGGYQTLMEALENVFEVITKLTNLTRGGLLKVIFGSKGDDIHSLTLMLIKATRSFKFFSEDLLRFTGYVERFNVIKKVFSGLHSTLLALRVPFVLIGKAIRDVLDPLFTYNGNKLKWPRDLALIASQLSSAFSDSMNRFNNFMRNDQTVIALSKLARGIASVLDLVISGFKEVISFIKDDIEPEVEKFRIESFLDILYSIGRFLTTLTSNAKSVKIVHNAMVLLVDVVGIFGDVLDIVGIAAKAFFDYLAWGSKDSLRDTSDAIAVIGTAISKVRDFLNAIIESDSVVLLVNSTLYTLSTILGIVKDAISGVVSAFAGSETEAESASNWITQIATDLGRFGSLLADIRDHLKKDGVFGKIGNSLALAFKAIQSVLQVVSYAARTLLFTIFPQGLGVASQAGSKLFDLFDGIMNAIIQISNYIVDNNMLDSVSNALGGIFNIVSSIIGFFTSGNPFETISNALKGVFEWGKKAFDVIKDGLQGVDAGTVLKTGGGLGLLALIAKKLYDIFNGKKSLIGSVKEFLESTSESITGMLDSVSEAIENFAENEKAEAVKNVAIGIALLAGSLFLLSLLDPMSLATSMLAITVGLLLMVGALYVLDKMDLDEGVADELKSVAISILLLAIAMLIMSAALKVLSKLDPAGLLVAVIAVIIVLAAVTLALIAFSEFARGKRMLAAGAALFMMAFGILILTAALAALSFIPFDKLQNGILALAFTLIIVGGALALLSLVGPKLLIAAGAILIVSVAIIALTAALLVLALIPGEALAKGLLMLAGTLIVMVAALMLLSLVGPLALVAAGALAILGVGILLAAAGLAIMAVALRILKPVKRDLPRIAAGLALIGAAMLVLGVGGIVAGLGLIGFAAMIPLAFALSLLRGLDVVKIAAGLALLGLAFIPLGIGGSVLGTGAFGLILGAAGLALLGLALPSLAKGIEAMNGISLATMAKLALGLAAIGLAGVFLMVGAVGLMIGTPALIVFSKALPPLADGLNAFANVAWGTIGKAAVILAEAILAMFAVNVISLLGNGMSLLLDFAESLPSLATGIDSFRDVSWEGMGKAAVALAEAILAMFAVDVISLLGDGMDLIGSFASQLPELADAIMSFDGVTGDSLVKAGQALYDAIVSMFATNIISLLGNGMDLMGSFAEQLPTLATGFKEFDSLNSDTIISVGNALGTSIKSIAGVGFASILDGTPALVKLGEALPTLATGFRAFEGLDPEWLRGTATALADAIKALTGDFFSNLLTKTPDYSSLASGITQIALAVALIPEDGGNRIMMIGVGLMSLDSTTEDILSSITTTLITIYTNVILYATLTIQEVQSECDSILEILRGFDEDLSSIINGMLNDLSSAASSAYSYGASIGQNLANGLWSQVAAVQEAANALAAAANMSNTTASNIKTVGGIHQGKPYDYAISGFKDMYNYQTSLFNGAGKAAGDAFSSGVRSSLGINSPSKVMAEIGKFTAMGFANGLSDGSSNVNSSVDAVMSPLLMAISSLMNEDLSPTITPVMDMTNIDAAADEFSNMFDATGSYAMAAAGRISANDRASRQGTVESNFTSDNGGVQNGITVNVYPSAGMDERALADKVITRINELDYRRSVAKG